MEIGNEINFTVPYFFHTSIDYESFKARTSLLIYLGWKVRFVGVDCFNCIEWMWYTPSTTTYTNTYTKSSPISFESNASCTSCEFSQYWWNTDLVFIGQLWFSGWK